MRSATAALACASAAGLLSVLVLGPTPTLDATTRQPPAADAAQREEQQARTTCGGCHAFAPPDILPKSAWRDTFVRMHFIRENRLPPVGPPDTLRRVQLPPDMEAVLPYFLSRAPERLPAPERWPDVAESPVRFVRHSLAMPDMPATPAVSSVHLVDVDGDKRLDVLGSDMRQGVIFTGRPEKAGPLSVIASIPHPAHVRLADVDKDGVRDLLVGDLGTFFPADHKQGAVIWLRGLATGKFSAFWLDGWPRIAGVDAADFNGDGKLDIGVAAFGWRKTGSIAILENRTANASQPSFTTHTIDPRTGSIAIVPADLNRDGRMDFIALLAQEHESVIAYLNTGGFTFEQKVIYTAPHPNWGSSGIEVVDLDGDGDLDVVLTHGDTFDDGLVKPYHGIQWLENKGAYPYADHSLAGMPGVLPSRAADLDADGDLDIVACALLAGGSDADETTLPALIWLEQTRRGTFVRHTIEMGMPRHATLDVGDIDGDGAADIIVGNFSINAPIAAWVDVWMNQAKKKLD